MAMTVKERLGLVLKRYLHAFSKSEKGSILVQTATSVIIVSIVMAGIMFGFVTINVELKLYEIYENMQEDVDNAMEIITTGMVKKQSAQMTDFENDYFAYGLKTADEFEIDMRYDSNSSYNYIKYGCSLPVNAQIGISGTRPEELRYQIEIYSRDGAIWHMQDDYNVSWMEDKIFPTRNTGQMLFTNDRYLQDHEMYKLESLEFNYQDAIDDSGESERFIRVTIVAVETLPEKLIEQLENGNHRYIPRRYKAEKLIYLRNNIRRRAGSARP